MELDSRLDAYAELVGSYARNSVSLEHAHMVSRGSTDGYCKVAKYEIRGRKISNRIDEILAIMMQGNAYRKQAKIKTYPTPTTNPVNQLITSQVETDKIAKAAQREADNIMAIAFPSGPEPPLAAINTVTTQTAQSCPTHSPLGQHSDHSETNSPDCLPRQLARTNNEPPCGQHRTGWKHKLLHNTNTGD